MEKTDLGQTSYTQASHDKIGFATRGNIADGQFQKHCFTQTFNREHAIQL